MIELVCRTRRVAGPGPLGPSRLLCTAFYHKGIFISAGAGDRTQGCTHGLQAFFHGATTLVPFRFSL